MNLQQIWPVLNTGTNFLSQGTKVLIQTYSTNTHTQSYFQTELRSDGYLLRFFSRSSRVSWMHSLVETFV